ncbi:MAG: helix-turn-helix domain-containing protein [Micromonosporaceae bacterium]
MPKVTKGSPWLRKRLAEELRRIREEKGVKQDRVAEHTGRSESAISRLENGETQVKPGDVMELLTFYGVDREQVDELAALARRARTEAGWWQPYDDVLPEWIRLYYSMEAEATRLMIYGVQLVQGLLQTDAYARALIAADHPTETTEEIDHRVASRMARQQAVFADKPQMWVILDEAVLRRAIGGSKTMIEQLQRLKQVAKWPNLTLQVVPFSLGAHTGIGASFTVLRMDASGAVYSENPLGSALTEDPEKVERASLVYDHLRAAASDPAQSLVLINEAIASH